MTGSDRTAWLRRRFLGLLPCCVLLISGCSGAGGQPDELRDFNAAMDAIKAGDKAKGLELLTACIDAKPTHYAYLERAKLYVAENKIKEAQADVKAGLALDPAQRELQYYESELEKPEGERFKKKFGDMPASRK
jgi:hypothetical protein